METKIIRDVWGTATTELAEKKLFLFDMDGTVYKEEKIFDGTLDLLSYIEEIGGKYVFITNNSSRSVVDYIRKVKGMGIQTDADHFFTSTQANISVQGATNDIKKCFRYAEWKSQIFHSIFTYSLVALIDEIKPSVAFLLSSKLIFSQSSR